MKSCLKIKTDNMFQLLVILIWTQTILLRYIRAAIMHFPVIGSYADMLISLCFVVAILFALPCIKIRKADLFFVYLVIVVFLLERIFYTAGEEYLSRYMVSFVIKALPLYFVGVSLAASADKEKIIDSLYILSMVTLVANIFYHFAFGEAMSQVASQYEGNMDLAYRILPHCCLIACYAVKRPTIISAALAVIGGLYLLMLGTRGAAMIYLVCVAVLFIMGHTSRGAIVKTVVLFGAAGGFISSSLFTTFILWLSQTAKKLGLSIRIFDKILSGTAVDSSGRDRIRNTLFPAIGESPIWGHGLCSDRVIAGNYAHNIAIELWVEFGIFIGTAILVALAVVLVSGFLRTKNEREKDLIFSLGCASVCKLFLSGSYLDERLLFLLLGVCVCSIRKNRTCSGTKDDETRIYADHEMNYG